MQYSCTCSLCSIQLKRRVVLLHLQRCWPQVWSSQLGQMTIGQYTGPWVIEWSVWWAEPRSSGRCAICMHWQWTSVAVAMSLTRVTLVHAYAPYYLHTGTLRSLQHKRYRANGLQLCQLHTINRTDNNTEAGRLQKTTGSVRRRKLKKH